MLFQAGSFAEFVNSYLQEKQDEEGGLEDIDDDGEPRDVTSCEAVTSLRWCVRCSKVRVGGLREEAVQQC